MENASSGNADGQNAASSKDSKAKDTGGSTKEAEAETSIKEEARKLIHVLNPTRVPPQYIQTVFYDQNGRYLPADTRHSAYGIVVLQDTKPGLFSGTITSAVCIEPMEPLIFPLGRLLLHILPLCSKSQKYT